MKHKNSPRSLVPATLAAFGAALLVSLSAAAQVRPVNAGPLWNNAHANRACPSVCARAGATWTQHWRTTVQGRMSVCDCNFPTATPAPAPAPTPPAATPVPTLTPGLYTAQHPHWSGTVTINADHTYARDNGDPGTWTYDGTTLVLAWRNWGPETLTRQADGSFRAASNGFTIRFAGPAAQAH